MAQRLIDLQKSPEYTKQTVYVTGINWNQLKAVQISKTELTQVPLE